jgi:ABC-type antimicrobial peptide transport system permease subunit
VVERRRELAIRMALGASADRVVRTVLREGLILILAGLVLGVAGAAAAARGLARLLYGVGPYDSVTFVGTAGVVAVLSVVACYLPARRAARVEPLELFRAE